MNLDKVGLFIAKLRKEKNMTQQDLADLIPVSREAISKWELGKNRPDIDTLMKICNIFNISFSEMLFGEEKNKNNKKEIENIAYNLYRKYHKNKKNSIFLCFALVIITLAFLVYYFLTTYNSLKVYYVGASGSNISIQNGIMVLTRDHIYFNLGDIDTINNEIKSAKLYYINKNNEEVFIMSGAKDFMFEDFLGYNEYVDLNEIDNIMNNMYLKVQFLDQEKDIKINFNKSFSNNSLFIKRNKLGGINENKISNNVSETELEKFIKNTFTLETDAYSYQKENKNYIYFIDPNLLIITIKNKDNTTDEYNYYLRSYLSYNGYDENYNVKNSFTYDGTNITCKVDKCWNEKEKIQDFFIELKKLLNQ